MHAIVKKGSTNPIYDMKLLFWIINYAEIEFRTENAISVFSYLRKIFGET